MAARAWCCCPDGERKRCKFRRNVGRPYCGDRVLVARADDALTGRREHSATRKNYFVRADERQRQHIIAANLDQVLIVVAARSPALTGPDGALFAGGAQSRALNRLSYSTKQTWKWPQTKLPPAQKVLSHMPDYEGTGLYRHSHVL